MNKRLIMIAVLASMHGVPAMAAEDSGSFRVGAGFSKSEIEYSDVNIEFDSKGWEVFGGYEFNRHLAVEFGYIDAGDDTLRSGAARLTFSSNAIFASVIGSLPVSDIFSLYGRAGLLHWDAEAHATNGALAISDSADGDDPYFGVGAAVEVEGALIRAEYRLTEIDEADLTSVGLQLVWRF